MNKLNPNKIGLIVGFFLAFVHLIWALAVAIIPGILQRFLDWVFNIHFLEPVWKLTTFDIMGAVWLIILTFVIGYIAGWIFAYVHNYVDKKCK